MIVHFTLEIRHSLSKEEFRHRILLAWSSLRVQHVLLMSKVHEDAFGQRDFVIELPKSKKEILEETAKTVVFLEDYYNHVDADDFHRHSLNVARIVNPSECLSKLFILPLSKLPNGDQQLKIILVMGHQICDGLSAYNWFSHFLRILNQPTQDMEREIEFFKSPENISSRLPPAQEDLYPTVGGTLARARWFWAIMRVLRHVQKTMSPTFVNPLRRSARLLEAVSFPPTYSKVFDYTPSRKPPLNTYHHNFSLSRFSTNRLIQLAREANVSVGAACFTLIGLSMMSLEEHLHPTIPLSQRLSFAASFPLNPRTFFNYTTPGDSCMLAFSDGVIMPFLPSDLPVEKRFRLIAKQVNRQLRQYQKRSKENGGKGSLEAHSPGRLLANGYLYQIECVQGKLPEHRRSPNMNPQGGLPANTSQFGATCGVSALGSTAHFLRPGMFDLNELANDGKNFVADFRTVKMGVRARDNEFLVGNFMDAEGILGFGVSFDGNAISEENMELWEEKMKGLLEPGQSRL
ncbi:hypothetical protein GQ43DRAFT_442306 [Delitschia confertaspora ATCC 74209]|uniref:Alcohol acetyltransferase n=1 Tax=Delitschia confertaspora ATCC 74209 TaxID=1513339 RepID=A0A9P4JNC9_9PLEO|nr:hypothetical protein GQ43DRAFT_442306 [Delitschia confertaspora ATCC 74209]